MKRSIKDVVSEFNSLTARRARVQELFSTFGECNVTIGGSYALKYHLGEFSDREVHDYDLILRARQEIIGKIQFFLSGLSDLGALLQGSSGASILGSYRIGMINGIPVDLLLVPDDMPFKGLDIIESIDDIKAIKRKWVDIARLKGEKPRDKDLEDLDILDNIVELPF